MPQVKAEIMVRLPTLFRWRMALSILFISWAAGLMASAINGFRFEVE